MGAVVDAVERDLADIEKRDKALAESALAATALALAKRIDDSSNSATSVSMCAKALNDTMEQLRALAPPKREMDKVDELAERRRSRPRRASTAD